MYDFNEARRNHLTPWSERVSQGMTRRQAAREIRDKIDALDSVLEPVPTEMRKDIIGQDADDELNSYAIQNLLDGMIQGGITTGDIRLADKLERIVNSINMVPTEQRNQVYDEYIKQHGNPEDFHPVETMQRVVHGIADGILRDATVAGLTTPGQDLNAGEQQRPLRP